MFQNLGLGLTPQRSAHLAALGALTDIAAKAIGTVMLLVGVIWLMFKLVELALTAIVEACNTIATTYNGADSLVKFLILLVVGYVIYRVVRRAGRFS